MRLPVLFAFALLAAGCSSRKHDNGDADGGPSLCSSNDCDGDGYPTPADCNDADPMVNPGAYDFRGNNVDDDCNGVVDDPVEACETIPAAPPGAPKDFAR